MKMPGLYYYYACFLMLFGQSSAGVHSGLLAVNIGTICVIFLIGRKLFNWVIGILSAAAFAVMSVSQTIQGFSANAEQLLLLPALAGILLLLYGVESRKAWYFVTAGLLMGLASVVKHQGSFLACFAGLYALITLARAGREKLMRSLALFLIFAAGVFVPFACLCIYFKSVGLFGDFWYWLFDYPRHYASMVSLRQGVQLLQARTGQMVISQLIIYILGLLGLAVLVFSKAYRKHLLFMILMLLGCGIAIVPGFHFYPHYFVLILPAAGLIAGVGAYALGKIMFKTGAANVAAAAVMLIAISYMLYTERNYLFRMSPQELSSVVFSNNPFVESVAIGDYIRGHSEPNEKIAVLGSEPQICFYAKRRSATPHIYVYPLMANIKAAKDMQNQLIAEIEKAEPRYLVLVFYTCSWLVGLQSDQSIFAWMDKFSSEKYHVVGKVERNRYGREPVFRWGADADSAKPQGEYVLIMERNG
jgi:hypothetical protein